jgi:hypothetical protein
MHACSIADPPFCSHRLTIFINTTKFQRLKTKKDRLKIIIKLIDLLQNLNIVPRIRQGVGVRTITMMSSS